MKANKNILLFLILFVIIISLFGCSTKIDAQTEKDQLKDISYELGRIISYEINLMNVYEKDIKSYANKTETDKIQLKNEILQALMVNEKNLDIMSKKVAKSTLNNMENQEIFNDVQIIYDLSKQFHKSFKEWLMHDFDLNYGQEYLFPGVIKAMEIFERQLAEEERHMEELNDQLEKEIQNNIERKGY
ncbi:hypothetical protein JCM14036_30500 [Desulfotomaculum defluvii]